MKRFTPLRGLILLLLLGIVGVLLASNAGLNAYDQYDRLYDSPPEEARRVLFVGNSHTFYNDLPGMIQHLAHEEGKSIWVEGSLRGGATLGDHWENPNLHQALSQGRYDVVILQGASLEPLFGADDYVENFQNLAALANEGGAIPILYEVWPRGESDRLYHEEWAPNSPEEFGTLIWATSERALKGSSAVLAPVGRAWEESRRRETGIQLYRQDGNHATRAGTYLAALVIYGVIAERELGKELWRPGQISESDGALLLEIANQVVEKSRR